MKKTRVMSILLAVILVCFSTTNHFEASTPATHEVSSVSEINDAIEMINTDGGKHIISLKSDITISDERISVLENGEMTVIGNGYSIVMDGDKSHFFAITGSSTILNLGSKDDANNTLSLSHINTTSGSSSTALSGNNNATINMYAGVTIQDYVSSGFTFGSAISMDSSTFNMYGGIITNCKLTNDGYSGAGVSGLNDSTINIQGNSQITNNTSAGSGAGVFLLRSKATISENVLIDGNSSGLNGGGIYGDSSTIEISDNVAVTNNKSSSGYGGGVFVFNGSNATISDGVNLESNSSAYGGGITLYNANATIGDRVSIINNNATIGGGILVLSSTLVADDTIKIINNTASSTGNNLFFYTFDHTFTLNTTTEYDENRMQLIDIRYRSSSGALDFDITGVASDVITSNEQINKYFSYEVPTLMFDIESNANHLILVDFVATKLPTPTVSIDFYNETLSGFKPNQKYTINGSEFTANASGTIEINTSYFNSSIEIIAIGNMTTTLDSDTQTLSIPNRPAIPTYIQNSDGTISTESGVQYSVDGGKTWTLVDESVITGLVHGQSVLLQKVATDSSFSSDVASLTVEIVTKLPTPTVSIDFYSEILTGFIPNQKYMINGEVFFASDSGELKINPRLFNINLTIIAVGNGINILDSDVQTLYIPSRPTNSDHTITDDGKVFIEAGNRYSLDDGKTWTSVENTTVLQLNDGQTILLQKEATNTNFIGEIVEVTIQIDDILPVDPNYPVTGDNTNLWFLGLAILSLSGITSRKGIKYIK